MVAHASERLLEGGRGIGGAMLAQTQRANRIPRVGGALACVEMTVAFTGELALEMIERAIVIAASEVNQSEHPVERDAAEARTAGRGLRCQPGFELAFGFRQHLPRDVHRRREPVCEREVGQQRQRPVRRAQPFLAPASRTRA